MLSMTPSLRTFAVTLGFAAAMIVTVVASALSISSTSADAGAVSINRLIPNYMLRWDNSLLSPAMMTPVTGK